jgi:lysozyme
MQVSQKGIDLIKKFEGLNLEPYKCPAGKWTIGYGHSITSSDYFGGATTESIANQLLQRDLNIIEAYLNSVLGGIKITQGMFDALASLVYNWGAANFGKSQGLKYLKTNKLKLSTKEFFSKTSGVVNINGTFSNGLFRRRQAELELWND